MYKNSRSNCKLLLLYIFHVSVGVRFLLSFYHLNTVFYDFTLSMLDLHESISCTLKNFSISEK